MSTKAAAKILAACKPWTRDEIAARAARDIPEGWYVNVGIGIPVLLPNYIPPEREVIIQSENGILGMGPTPADDKINRWLINASKKYVTLVPGASIVHHADSFAMIRGGHLDLCVLGSFQVAENGDFANWTSDGDDMPSVGGAMDLAAGAKAIWLLMDHTTKSGESKVMRRCTYPLTAVGAAKRVYTNLAVLDITDKGFAVRDMAPGLTFEALQDVTDAPLHGELIFVIAATGPPSAGMTGRSSNTEDYRALLLRGLRAGAGLTGGLGLGGFFGASAAGLACSSDGGLAASADDDNGVQGFPSEGFAVRRLAVRRFAVGALRRRLPSTALPSVSFSSVCLAAAFRRALLLMMRRRRLDGGELGDFSLRARRPDIDDDRRHRAGVG